jgi:hypothetical protein
MSGQWLGVSGQRYVAYENNYHAIILLTPDP